MNRLADEKSAYLRHAADQKVDWYPWSEEAFEKAARENKPVFLSSGAIWCHWCHVMAKESFEDDEIARIINENFVAVKVDRDERPDIDRRYQKAVAAMGQSGGWPLNVFLTPDKRPFFGGTYFPPVDGIGLPSFPRILLAIDQYYREKRDEIEEQGSLFISALKSGGEARGSLSAGAIDAAADKMLASVDKVHGGFGSAPKFPMSGALEFLLGRYFLTGNEGIAAALKKTLYAMALGGFHDQLGGGFHRYSTDQAWGVPHFEKMADDNAWLLRNYCDAYRAFGDPYFKEVAEGIIRFVDKELSGPAGGFYASMDADVTPDDEGGYFTWTRSELEKALTGEELEVLSRHLFDPRKAVYHEPDKVVLSVAESIDDIAVKTGRHVPELRATIASGKEKLLAEREKRLKPYIDTAMYSSLNGMMISAYCRAYRALGDGRIIESAAAALDTILSVNVRDGQLYHSEGVSALLEDYVYLCDALISVYEATGEDRYFREAKRLFDICLERFRDTGGSGFFDTEEEVIGLRLKGIEDVPRPSPNALAVIVLLKLAAISGEDAYRSCAEDSLRAFLPDAGAMSIHAGYFFCALEAFFRMLKLEVHSAPASDIAKAARLAYYPYSVISYRDTGEDSITPCEGTTCHQPVNTAQALDEFLKDRKA